MNLSGSCVIQMIFYVVRHFSPKRRFFLWIFLLVRKQYLPKKNLALLAQAEKNCQNPFQAILRKQKKEKKKWNGPLIH